MANECEMREQRSIAELAHFGFCTIARHLSKKTIGVIHPTIHHIAPQNMCRNMEKGPNNKYLTRKEEKEK